MFGRHIVAAASFARCSCRARHSHRHQRRMRRGPKISSSRRSSAIRRRSKRPACAMRRTPPPRASVPLTLEDAVRRAIDNNLEMAVERLNPQTFDFTLAALRANYKPDGDVAVRTPRQRAAADEPAESRQPERLDDDLQLGHHAEPRVGRRQLGADLQQLESRFAERSAGVVRSAVQQLATCSATRSRCCAASGSTRRASRCRRPSSTATTPS